MLMHLIISYPYRIHFLLVGYHVFEPKLRFAPKRWLVDLAALLDPFGLLNSDEKREYSSCPSAKCLRPW